MSVELQGISAVEAPFYALAVTTSTSGQRLTDLQDVETAQALSTIVTTKPWRGVWLQNQDTGIGIYVKSRLNNNANGFLLGPGEKEFIPERDLENIVILAASGSPLLGVLVK